MYKGSDVKEATVRTYAYDSYGKVTEIKDYRNLLSDGDKTVKKTYTYDSFDRVAKMVYTNLEHPETVMESYAYSYDKNSNIVEKTQVNNYPQKNEEKVNETKRYTYDKVGNRLAEDKGESKTTYDYNGLDQVTTSTTWKDGTAQENKKYAYDKNGNEIGQTNSKTGEILYRAYDAENRLTEVSVNKDGKNAIVQQNRYNGDGQRIQRVEGDQTTNYYYQDNVVSYTTDGKGDQTSQDLLGTDGNVIGTQRYTGNGTAYYVYNKDVQGSTTNLVRDDGKADVSYHYEDFGETTSVGENTSGNEICYTGGRYDETTGLYYLNARYYNPEDGRFLTEDTYRGETNEPDTQHLYAYCADNPVNYVDPSGHKKQKKWTPLPTWTHWYSQKAKKITRNAVRAFLITCIGSKIPSYTALARAVAAAAAAGYLSVNHKKQYAYYKVSYKYIYLGYKTDQGGNAITTYKFERTIVAYRKNKKRKKVKIKTSKVIYYSTEMEPR